jgi:hypothetical protein
MAIYLEWRLLVEHPIESLCGLATIAAGAIIYLWVGQKKPPPPPAPVLE